MCEYNNSGRPEMAGGDIDLNAALLQKDLYIREQHEQIIRLKRELNGVASERDLLLCEVSNLRFELEMVELKRLQDERVAKTSIAKIVRLLRSTMLGVEELPINDGL
ncbi:hypothetical protein FQR65_LT00438 [Abscondita terminalis]|nr:hypothetical protein FQR65_LT00438 [Abscondita terminalis]